MNIDAIEQSRIDQQQNLDRQKNAAERNRLGQFATPSGLALEIVRYVRKMWQGRADKVRFLDPAIGTGSFYSALIRVFGARLVEKATGIELDPTFAEASRSLWRSTGLHVTTGDFTRQPPPATAERYNLVLTNPPYVRHHHLPAEDKHHLRAAVKQVVGLDVNGLAGLYVYFLLLSNDWMREDGVGVWLIPSEFMNVNYGHVVREYLTRQVTLLHVHRFAPPDVQFCDALVTSAVVVFAKRRPSSSGTVRLTFGGSILEPEVEEHVSLAALRSSGKWASYPRRSEGPPTDRSNLVTLGDLFTIKRGVATGANGFFILRRAEARRIGIPDESLRPILPSPRYLTGARIERCPDGWPLSDRQLALIDCSMAEGQIQVSYPGFWAYLQSGMESGVHQGYLTSRRHPWYSQEHRDRAAFLCTYMGRSRNGSQPLRFLWNKSEATAANVYLLLYPKGRLKALLKTEPEKEMMVVEGLQEIHADHFIARGRVYGGGLYKVEPSELASLPGGSITNRFPEVTPLKQSGLPFRTPG